jgi:hypothetical protein
VTFRDADGILICDATLDSNPVSTTASCFAGPLSTPLLNPITASYSGTQTGFDDGYGTSYGASSGSGVPAEGNGPFSRWGAHALDPQGVRAEQVAATSHYPGA